MEPIIITRRESTRIHTTQSHALLHPIMNAPIQSFPVAIHQPFRQADARMRHALDSRHAKAHNPDDSPAATQGNEAATREVKGNGSDVHSFGKSLASQAVNKRQQWGQPSTGFCFQKKTNTERHTGQRATPAGGDGKQQGRPPHKWQHGNESRLRANRKTLPTMDVYMYVHTYSIHTL